MLALQQRKRTLADSVLRPESPTDTPTPSSPAGATTATAGLGLSAREVETLFDPLPPALDR